jgi:murein DD-endopeptidase MepM/ murein hydrolase activator NlpD
VIARRTRIRTLGVALLASAVLATFARPAGAARGSVRIASVGESISQKQAEISATRQRLDLKRNQLHFQEVREGDLQRQLEETNRGISRVTANLDDLSAQMRWNQRKLAWTSEQLAAAKTTLERHNDALRRRLVDAYERGDTDYLNVLLSATSFTDFAERWEDIRYLVAANQRTVRERRAAERAVEAVERQVEGERIVLDDVLAREKQTRFQLAALATTRTQLVVAAEAQRRSVSTEVAQLEELSAAQEAELENFIRARQRLEEERREAADAERRRAAQLAGQAVPPPENTGAPGTFSWPASGPITDPFGMRMHPITHQWKMHSGMDIGAPMGSTITAAAGGKIIYAGWEGGYGNTIIIDHGGNTSTLYGHCSQLFVSEGQEVQRGQAIGAVGSTGESTGPHLHFEIRINGVPVDPAPRLR